MQFEFNSLAFRSSGFESGKPYSICWKKWIKIKPRLNGWNSAFLKKQRKTKNSFVVVAAAAVFVIAAKNGLNLNQGGFI